MTIGEMIWCANCVHRNAKACPLCKVRNASAKNSLFDYDYGVAHSNDTYYKGYRPPKYFKAGDGDGDGR